MNNRTAGVIVVGMTVLALIGISGMVMKNPSGFLQGIAVIAVVGIIIYLIIRLNIKDNPQKNEQRAFMKAAKKSKKRLQKKGELPARSAAIGTLAPLKKVAKKKKKTTAHLTVIDGKKGKKKNRASF